MSHNCKNYAAHGGCEWVVGGKLTFLPGATVEGGEGLFGDTDTASTPMPNQEASSATTIALLKDDFNALLTKLKDAGLMVADTPAEEPGGDESP